MGAANAHICLRRPFKLYYLWPTCHFHVGNTPCLLHTQFITELVFYKPHRHKHICDNPHNLMTTVCSTLCTIWKFQVDYSHCISTPNGECVCYTCTCDWEPACVHNPILHTCGYFAMTPQINGLTGLCSCITPKEEKGKKQDKSNQFSVLLAMTFFWKHQVLSLMGLYQKLKCLQELEEHKYYT